MLDADASGVPYALDVPGRRFAAARGPAHRAACLEALALVDAPGDAT